MPLIHLIRHAEPTISGVMLGRADPPARTLPAKSELAVKAVFSSPLRRARETALALFPEQGITIVNDLAEVSLGEWDGLSWEEIERRDPELAQRKLEDWFAVTAPGGEAAEEISRRATAALELIREASAPVAVVGHLGMNAFLWNLLTGAPSAAFTQKYLEVKTHDDMD